MIVEKIGWYPLGIAAQKIAKFLIGWVPIALLRMLRQSIDSAARRTFKISFVAFVVDIRNSGAVWPR